MASYGRAAVLCCGWIASHGTVRAQDQFVVAEYTYRATVENTSDSHYFVAPLAGTPSNWQKPIDYASGSVHARVDILEKPSAKKTLYNICFEGTPTAACMPYSPAYTGTGVVEFSHPFSAFYQYKDVDWSKGVKRVALILKDESGTKMQGSPDFYPTRVHITLTVVRPGATYVAPAEPGDAGTPRDTAAPSDAASKPTPDAGPRDASGGSALDGATYVADAAAPAVWDASTTAGDAAAPDARDGAAPGAPNPDAGFVAPSETGAPGATPDNADDADESGCSARHKPVHSRIDWLLLAAAAALCVNRARSRRS